MGLFMATAYILTPSPQGSTTNLEIGEKAWEDVKSNFDFTVIDEVTTKRRRQEAENAVLSVYDYDSSLRDKLYQRLAEIFGNWRQKLRERRMRETLGSTNLPLAPLFITPSNSATPTPPSETDDYEQFLSETGLKISQEAFKALQTLNFSIDVERGVRSILDQICNNAIVGDRNMLLEQANGGLTQRDLANMEEKNIYNLVLIISLEDVWREIDALAAKVVPDNQKKDELIKDLVAEVSRALIRPNLTFNMQETQTRRRLARDSIKPVYFNVTVGEVIVHAGERVTPEIKIRLDQLNRMGQESRISVIFIGNLLLVAVLFLIATIYIKRFHRNLISDRSRLFLIGLITLLQVILVTVCWKLATFIPDLMTQYPFDLKAPYRFAVPFAIGSMLMALLVDVGTAVLFSFIFGILAGILGERDFFIGLYSIISGYSAVFAVTQYKQRTMIIQGGFLVGLANLTAIVLLHFIRGELAIMPMALSGLGAIFSGLLLAIIVTAILPVLEWLFKIPTDIRLLELSNFNQPLLRELAMEAPGTHHHSILVGDLAECAAEAIGANSLLARVGAYYHDIGKISKPSYFIENTFGRNPHDELTPNMSAMIIRKHVKEGVELAMRWGLGRDIIHIIEQHHGTSLLTFFYDKAVSIEHNDKENISEDVFRYPGPKPRSKEAAIVLIADAVEAAARSISSPSTSSLKSMVSKITLSKFQDHQFDDCELTFRELTIIAESLYHRLLRNYHSRIKYPGFDFDHHQKDGTISETKPRNGQDS